jgi:putative ABC transport system ATP-binding protein
VLNIQSICKSFDESVTPLLNNVSFSLADGESLAIMGASGSGKSTLLNIIAGLTHCESGTIYHNSADLNRLSSSQRDRYRAEHFGMVFQQFNLIDSLNVEDNASLPARYLGLPYAERLSPLIEQLGLANKKSSPISQLSGGEQQRVAIARALVHKPSLILADEPTGNLDNQTSEKVSNVLYDLVRESGTSMIIVTHSEDVANKADRVVQLKQGRLV